MADRVRWGILGVAKIARNEIIPAFKTTRFAELIAIASRDGPRAAEAASACGAAKWFSSYEAMLADPEIDAIYSPLPNHLHASWTIRALEAGKHVLCEKPIALNEAEAREIAAAARRTGRFAAEAFMVRFHPQWATVQGWIEQGRIGAVRAIQSFFFYDNRDPANIRNDAAKGGGGLYDIGCYQILLARSIFGVEPVKAIGLFDRDPALGIDRLTGGLIAFPQGRILEFVCSTQMCRAQAALIHGERGRIEMATPFNPGSERPARLLIDDCRDLFGGGAVREEVPAADSYALQFDAFCRAILDGVPPMIGIADAIANMRVIDALFASERSGAWVAL